MKKLFMSIIGLSFALSFSPVLADTSKDNSDQAKKTEQQSKKAPKHEAAEKQPRQQQNDTGEQDTGVSLSPDDGGSAFGNWKLKGNDY